MLCRHVSQEPHLQADLAPGHFVDMRLCCYVSLVLPLQAGLVLRLPGAVAVCRPVAQEPRLQADLSPCLRV
jgi:hypothetical protein